ncbi:MAG: LamG domain-containing protein, partial [Spirochaetia bacterium]|nr:LamG domain-containing protein [Spirochaetia bacterium]
LSFWLRSDNFRNSPGGFVFDIYDTNRSHFFVRKSLYNDDNLQIAFQEAGANAYAAGAGLAMTANQWTQVAITWDSALHSAKIYQNGVLVHSLSLPATWTPNAQNFVFGSTVSGMALKGSFDSIRLYNRVLADAEVMGISADRN